MRRQRRCKGRNSKGRPYPSPQTQTKTPSSHSLLPAQNGLDNGVHFTPAFSVSQQRGYCEVMRIGPTGKRADLEQASAVLPIHVDRANASLTLVGTSAMVRISAVDNATAIWGERRLSEPAQIDCRAVLYIN